MLASDPPPLQPRPPRTLAVSISSQTSSRDQIPDASLLHVVARVPPPTPSKDPSCRGGAGTWCPQSLQMPPALSWGCPPGPPTLGRLGQALGAELAAWTKRPSLP